MKRFTTNYVHFSRKERTGAILLAFFCTAIFAFPDIARRFYPQQNPDFTPFQEDIRAFREVLPASAAGPQGQSAELFEFDPNTASQETFVRLGLSEKVARTICNYRDKGGKFRKPEDFRKIWSLDEADFERLLPYIRMEGGDMSREERPSASTRETALFAFDPNDATEHDFQRLGLPPWTIRSILNYRSKGGRFRNSADFRKIFNLSEQDYARLESFIRIEGEGDISLVSPRPLTHSGAGFREMKQIDINASGTEDWQMLPGIGEKRAQQILRYREALGGFLSIEQVGETKTLPDSVFQKIKPRLLPGRTDIRQIDLNAAAEADLSAHPYISGKQARLIVAYRQQHGAFTSAGDLEKIVALDRDWLAKVRPYLTAK